jgi:hypothetical protein
MENSTDFGAAKPILNIVMQAHHPNIKWTKQDFQGIKIFVDRTGSGYEFLATDTFPNYLETAPMPAVGESAVWKYRAIYIMSDEEVGEFSDEMSVSVTTFV